MGGVKKRSMASMEKKQDSGDTEQQTGATSKGKKGKEQKAPPQQQKRLPFLVPKLTEEEMMKSLAPLKAITVHSASRALGVNASIATGMLRALESRALLLKAGGFSGHVVWSVAPRQQSPAA